MSMSFLFLLVTSWALPSLEILNDVTLIHNVVVLQGNDLGGDS